jgi:hypothetical protein
VQPTRRSLFAPGGSAAAAVGPEPSGAGGSRGAARRAGDARRPEGLGPGVGAGASARPSGYSFNKPPASLPSAKVEGLEGDVILPSLRDDGDGRARGGCWGGIGHGRAGAEPGRASRSCT